MTRKLTLFLVCAFEIGLILFVAAWAAKADWLSCCKEVSSNPMKIIVPIVIGVEQILSLERLEK